MKALKILLICGLVLGFAVPVFAAQVDNEDDWRFNISFLRYRFDWELSTAYQDGSGDFQEYMDDDLDTTWRFNKGDIEVFWEFEMADGNLGNDNPRQPSYDAALGAYSGKWMPSAWADREFRLEFGDFGTGYGLRINNDDSPHGSIEAGWSTASAGNWVLAYGKTFEGDTNDDVEGDGHLVRGQAHFPLGESGMKVGAYLAFYLQDNVDLVEATDATVEPGPDENRPVITIPGQPRIQGDQNVFLGSVDFSGSLATWDFFSELGWGTGSRDVPRDDNDDDIFDDVFNQDLSGFYITGGANFGAGKWSLGVEAGYAPGELKLDERGNVTENTGFVAVNEDYGLGEILHDEGMIKNTSGDKTSLSNLIFAQLSGSTSVNKWDFFVGGIYFAPVEDIVSEFTGEITSNYGFEIFGNLKYNIADYLSWTAFYGIAFPDSDFVADTQYQLVNRIEFLF